MSGNLLEWMEEFWKDSRKYNPLHKPIESMMRRDSQNVARIGNALGWDWLEQEGRKNADDPVRGIARASLTAGGIFAAPYVYGAAAGGGGAGQVAAAQQALAAAKTAEEIAAAQQALQAAMAAEQAASAGMFAQIPGVQAGSQQAQMLAAQNAGLGGSAADLTAKAAMSGVKDAYAAGNMGTLEYLGNVAKADLAGMNDPSVWADRFARNAGKIAGNYGKAQLAGMFVQPQPQRAPPPPPPQQAQQPLQSPYGSRVQQLIEQAAAGDKQAIEELRKMGIDLRSMA